MKWAILNVNAMYFEYNSSTSNWLQHVVQVCELPLTGRVGPLSRDLIHTRERDCVFARVCARHKMWADWHQHAGR